MTVIKTSAPGARGGSATRPPRSRKIILDTAGAILAEKGPAGFTVEAVVERTGVAKTTIYRHWPSRSDLLAATITEMGGKYAAPDTGTLREDLLEFFTIGVHAVGDLSWRRHLDSLPSIIEAMKRDPELVDAGAKAMRGAIAALSAVIEGGIARGEVRADRDVDAIAQVFLGAMLFHHGFLSRDPTEEFVIEVIDTVLEGITPPKS